MIEINLLPDELKAKTKAKKTGEGFDFTRLLAYLPYLFMGLLAVHIILGAVMAVKTLQLNSVNSQWQRLEPQRKSLEEISRQYSPSGGNNGVIGELMKNRLTWADKMNRLSLGLPYGIWFREITITPKEFILYGSAVSLYKEEMALINRLIDSLKNDTDFFKGFVDLELDSLQHRTIATYDVTDFVLTGALK